MLTSFPDSPMRQAKYLAFEILKMVLPAATDRFEARFEGLSAFFQIQPPENQDEIREVEEGYSPLALTLREGQSSGRFIRLVIDAIFLDFLKLHRNMSPWEAQERFCRDELVEFIRSYFPDLKLPEKDLTRLAGICLDLKNEAVEVSCPPPASDSDGYRAGHLANPPFNCHSPVWLETVELAGRAARSKAPILLGGESGVGKEVLARYIHSSSPRASNPFVAVNCGAIPENLIESEFFGYLKGAFSGAGENRTGLAARADGGTLFLDEIGQMPNHMQVKLLRFLQDHAITPLGGGRSVALDVRVVAATNLDLDEAMSQGLFRPDLYYRLNVFHLILPSLRDRPEDLPALAEYFIRKYNGENDCQVRGLGRGAMKVLQAYHWPGNVRELENMIQRAVILAGEGLIKPEHLPETIRGGNLPGQPRGPLFPSLDRPALNRALEEALGAGSGAGRGGLGASLPRDQLVYFLSASKGRPFAPKDLADHITPPGWTGTRNKLTHQILKALHQAGILEHNNGHAQASRYKLNPEFLTPRPETDSW